MSLTVINSVQPTQTANGAHASVAANGGTYLIEANGSLSATGDGANGIHAPVGNLNATVLGSVSAQQWGIYAAGWDSNIEIGIGGSVYGEEKGLYLAGDPFSYQGLKNSGFLGGRHEGARLKGFIIDVFNDGTISSQQGIAIAFEMAVDPELPRPGSTKLVNIGKILGGGVNFQRAIEGSQGGDTVVNRGIIKGDVSLGDGDDIFDNRDGILINSTISMGSGTNTLWSGSGDDAILVGMSDDFIDAGAGIDTIQLLSGNTSFRLKLGVTNVQDTGIGFKTILNVENVTAAGSGNHFLTGNAGDNSIGTSSGNDTLDGGLGNDTLGGGGGSDTALFSDMIGAVVDLNKQGQAQNTGYGLDTLISIENLEGGSGSDHFTGNDLANILTGHGGNDTLNGGLGDDTLDGGTGINTAIFSGTATQSQVTKNGDGTFTVTGPDGTDLLRDVRLLKFTDKTVALWNTAPTGLALSTTQVAEDALTGTIVATLRATDADGDALTYTLAGTDGPFRIDGNNLVLTGALDYETKTSHSLTVTAKDTFGLSTVQAFTFGVTNVVEANPLTLFGTGGADELTGEAGNDVLYGAAGNDVLKGEAGNDKLYGGLGKDTLSGGTGQDVFVFDTRPNKSTNVDTITDFSVADDTIHLAKSIFRAIAKKGVLKADAFYVGAKTHDADDRIIYDKKKGALYYDADGTGGAAQVQIATLSKNLKMTNKDFFVI
ncbi:cadherin domain-containing protein [Microvirga sp. 2MCAF38]|uniref:cadherin domain-containing protein n=1 Tax=Microvirga sp. 2MCAF38 TaxID=3232989 RepID=UPI003F9A529F